MRIKLGDQTVYYGTANSTADANDHIKLPIVMVHGAGFDHSVWVMVGRYFARHGHRVLAPDLPAHGRSSGPALTSIEEMADWLATLLADQSVGPAVVIGHSMGSLVVSALAARHPQRVARVALLGTSDPMAVGPPLLAAATDDDAAAFAMANTWSHSTQGRMGRAATPGQSNFVSGTRWLERMQSGVYHADLRACNEFEMNLQDITQPSLVVAGSEDKMTPERAGKAVAKQLGNSEIVLLDCGHAMLSEKPNEILDALAGFVLNTDEGARE